MILPRLLLDSDGIIASCRRLIDRTINAMPPLCNFLLTVPPILLPCPPRLGVRTSVHSFHPTEPPTAKYFSKLTGPHVS